MESSDKLGAKSPRAIEILRRVQGTNRIVPDAPVVVAPPAPVVPPVLETKVEPKNDYDINPPKPGEVAKPAEVVKVEQPVLEDPTDEFEESKDPVKVSGHFKKLRTKFQALNQSYHAASEELTGLRKKVTDYESGLAVPEITQQQGERIAQLEQYEKLYNLKATPVYQEKVGKPLKNENDQLTTLATEYKVDIGQLARAFELPTAEQNRLLTQLFQDEVGALEAKSIFKNIRKIQSEAVELEKEPAQSLARLQAENDRIVAEKRSQANEVIVHTSKEAWSEALNQLRSDNRFPEITFKEGDTEHNEKYVRPILTKAGQEYGRIVRTLAEHGLTELPKELAMAFANMTQLAHQSAVVAVQRDTLAARVSELEKLLGDKNRRPGVSSTAGAPTYTNGVDSKAVGPMQAGKNVLSRTASSLGVKL